MSKPLEVDHDKIIEAIEAFERGDTSKTDALTPDEMEWIRRAAEYLTR